MRGSTHRRLQQRVSPVEASGVTSVAQLLLAGGCAKRNCGRVAATWLEDKLFNVKEVEAVTIANIPQASRRAIGRDGMQYADASILSYQHSEYSLIRAALHASAQAYPHPTSHLITAQLSL